MKSKLGQIVHENLGVEHENDLRSLDTIFNGDLDGFQARSVVYLENLGEGMLLRGIINRAREVLYLLSGEGEIAFMSGDKYKFNQGDRILIPDGLEYGISLTNHSELIVCREGVEASLSMSEQLVFDEVLAGFVAKQVKIARMKVEALLGSHFHHHGEFFSVLKGNGVFGLEDLRTGKKETCKRSWKESILVPAKCAHKVLLSEDAVLLGFTQEPYISPEHNDYPHNMDHFDLKF